MSYNFIFIFDNFVLNVGFKDRTYEQLYLDYIHISWQEEARKILSTTTLLKYYSGREIIFEESSAIAEESAIYYNKTFS